MRTILLSVITCLLSTMTVFSQRIYFCSNYTDYGDPVSAGNTWNINSGGGNVYILFQNAGRPLNVNTITIYIDKLNTSSQYAAWDNKYPSVNPDKTWAVIDYKFTTAGDYRVTVLINLVEIVKEYISIKLNNSVTTASDILYYSGATVTPGTGIDATSGYVYGVNGPFYLDSRSEAKIYFKVSNGEKSLNTSQLIVDIYKKNSSDKFDFYRTEKFDAVNLNWVYFVSTFYAKGSYRASVYNAGSNWINDAYFTIN